MFTPTFKQALHSSQFFALFLLNQYFKYFNILPGAEREIWKVYAREKKNLEVYGGIHKYLKFNIPEMSFMFCLFRKVLSGEQVNR